MTLVHVSNISLHLHSQVDNNMEKKVNHHQSNQFPPTPFLLI